MFMGEVDKVNPTSTCEIEDIIQQHGFMPLPTKEDCTHLAFREYNVQGIVCFDFLVYRKANEKGKTLRDEVSLLNQILSHLLTQLHTHPSSLNQKIHSHAISFLGKKVPILANKSGRPLKSRFLSFLVVGSDIHDNPIIELNSRNSTLVIQRNNLNQFLAENYPKITVRPYDPKNNFRQLRNSYQYLGMAFILLPFLVGLSGFLWGVGILLGALPLFLCGLFGFALLIRKAQYKFNKFQHPHTISIIDPIFKSPPIPKQESPKTIIADSDCQSKGTQEPVATLAGIWLHNTTSETDHRIDQKAANGERE